MKGNIQKLMKLVSIVEQIVDSKHFFKEQFLAQQNLKNIVSEGLQTIEECSTHLRRVEYEWNLYYKLLNNVAPHELEKSTIKLWPLTRIKYPLIAIPIDQSGALVSQVAETEGFEPSEPFWGSLL